MNVLIRKKLSRRTVLRHGAEATACFLAVLLSLTSLPGVSRAESASSAADADTTESPSAATSQADQAETAESQDSAAEGTESSASGETATASAELSDYDGMIIPEGIFAEGIDLSGMSAADAVNAINQYFQKIADSKFTITCYDGKTEEVPVSDWDFTWNAAETVRTAMKMSRTGGLINEYKDQMDLKYGNIYLDVDYSIDETAVRNTLDTVVSTHDSPAKNAAIKLKDGKFVVSSEGKNGTITDDTATYHAILNQFTDHLSNKMGVKVTTKTDTPHVTAADLSVIKDKLGSCTTEYGDSRKGRKQNIKTATGYLNGMIVMPGEQVSVSTAIKPRTEENGYAISTQYVNGESEEDVGGGVCQVATTLYNALLRAELQIDERHNHSMVVHYVDYAADAAIATGSKDLVFTNNLKNPIYIYGEADGDNVTYTIYGVETRPANREVKYVSETLSEEYPKGTKDTYSDELKTGETETTGARHPEVTATLTKVVTVDGKETERDLLHTDYYRGSVPTVIHGTG